jgi:hypothetical protein
MIKKRLIGVLTFVAAAAASVFALTQGTFRADIPAPAAETETPTAGSAPCAYIWAYQDLPDITAEFADAIRTPLPEASARVQAYGENCVAEDGSSTFSAMETDFYITIPVPDLTDHESLGTLVEMVLSFVDDFPRPRVPGGIDGFVEFTFKNGDQQRILRVSIPRGVELRQQGLRGAELIQALETP